MSLTKRVLKTARLEAQRKWDEFLDIYSLYLTTRLEIVREDLLEKAEELQKIDKRFIFQI
jgi:hypothetical protein